MGGASYIWLEVMLNSAPPGVQHCWWQIRLCFRPFSAPDLGSEMIESLSRCMRSWSVVIFSSLHERNSVKSELLHLLWKSKIHYVWGIYNPPPPPELRYWLKTHCSDITDITHSCMETLMQMALFITPKDGVKRWNPGTNASTTITLHRLIVITKLAWADVWRSISGWNKEE